ncbi:MAG TPA: hypothetical protein PLQ36_00685 [Candidatus Gracilibacteria bacterium]|nr:hypothetical protein [Candidatus Gracilibacteria bacterium]
MNIAIDFDGTCVTHDFPEIGKEIGASLVLQELVEQGHNLILFTMRSDRMALREELGELNRDYLTEALAWFAKHNIPLWGIQRNPEQDEWTTSPKAYAKLYIDDAALGCPLKSDTSLSHRPFVDWEKVREMLVKKGILV